MAVTWIDTSEIQRDLGIDDIVLLPDISVDNAREFVYQKISEMTGQTTANTDVRLKHSERLWAEAECLRVIAIKMLVRQRNITFMSGDAVKEVRSPKELIAIKDGMIDAAVANLSGFVDVSRDELYIVMNQHWADGITRTDDDRAKQPPSLVMTTRPY